MSRHSPHAPALACTLVIALHAAAPTVHAAVLNWTTAANGFIGVAGNWSPAQVPAAGDILRFDVGPGPYTLTCTSAVPSVASHDYRQGTVHISCNQPHDLTTQLAVGSGAGQVVTARLQLGTLESGWSTLVGTGAGADGTLQVIGGSAQLVQNSGPGSPVFTVGGANASGTVRIASGGIVEVARSMDLGLHAGSLGTLRVVGESAGAGAHASQLLVNATAGDVTLGADSGHGVFEVSDGGFAHVQRHLVLAAGLGDVADMTVGGSGALADTRVEVGGDLRVAANTTSASAAGTANLTLADGAIVNVAGTTTIGDLDGSTAAFTMQAGSQLVTHSLSTPQLTALQGASGGLIQVDGGTWSASLGGLRLPGGPDGPDFEMRNRASGAFASLPPLPSMVVGDGSFARLTMLDSSSVTTSGGRGVLGSQAGSSGVLEVREGSTFTSTARLDVGDAGTGFLGVWSRATATMAGIDIARQPGSTGTLSVRDLLSRLVVTDQLNVGGTSTLRGGTGSVDVLLQGTLDLQRTGKSGKVWSGSTISVSDLSKLLLAAPLDIGGVLQISGGSVQGGTISLLAGGVLAGRGDVASIVTTGTDTTTRITAQGDLSLGNPLVAGSFTNRGLLEVGPHQVTLRSTGAGLLVGNCTLSGGGLHLGSVGTLEAGKRITGTGTVFGTLTCQGDVIASGAAGLTIGGTLAGTGTGVGGTLLRFASGAAFSGGGRLDLPVIADAGSSILLGSDLVMGRAGVANAVQMNAALTIGSHRLELRSASDVQIAGVSSIAGGTLDLTGGGTRLRIVPGGALWGLGAVDAPLTVEGLIGIEADPMPLSVAGDVQCAAGGLHRFELGNASAGFYARLVSSGPVTLAGTFDLQPVAGYQPGHVDSLKVISGAARTGTFSTLLYAGQPVAGEYELHYAPDGVWVVFPRTVGVDDRPTNPGLPTVLRFAAMASPGARPSLELSLPELSTVRVDVFDVRGRRVATLHHGPLASGRHRWAMERAPLGAGVHYARAEITTVARSESRTVRFVTLP